MDAFYTREKPETGRYVATVLEGPDRGRKIVTDIPIKEWEGNRTFCEFLPQQNYLLICGAGHVSIPIIQMGKMMGFYITVLEDRPLFADHARKAGADRVICAPFRQGVREADPPSGTYAVIVTRGHRYDQECLEEILPRPMSYVGMMGSRRRTAIIRRNLLEKGMDPLKVEELHAPIGLPIGAETPEELAVSIWGEIIEIKNREKSGEGYTSEIWRAIRGSLEDGRKSVVATIVGRKGSAPRKTGTKMVIREDGALTGSIGGGCAESEIIRTALSIMRTGTPSFALQTVEMTAEEAMEEGMVCGGTIEVSLELLEAEREKS